MLSLSEAIDVVATFFAEEGLAYDIDVKRERGVWKVRILAKEVVGSSAGGESVVKYEILAESYDPGDVVVELNDWFIDLFGLSLSYLSQQYHGKPDDSDGEDASEKPLGGGEE